MIPSKWTRFKRWICMQFGHSLKYSHRFNGNNFYVCRRCNVLNDEDSFEKGRENWHATRDRKKHKA